MATQPIAAPASPSLILALHARYEASIAEYDTADTAQPVKPRDSNHPDWALYHRLERGKAASAKETAAIRQALLHQVPDTDEEATVLAYHVWSTCDRGLGSLTEHEWEAAEQGLNSLFDYLVSEGRADMEKMGREFTNGAMLAFERRRARTGQLED